MYKDKSPSEIRKLHQRQKLDPEISRIILEKIREKEFSPAPGHPVFWTVFALSQTALLILAIYFFVFANAQVQVEGFASFTSEKNLQIAQNKIKNNQNPNAESANLIFTSSDSSVQLRSSSDYYQFNSKVKLKVLSDEAKLEKSGDNEVKLVAGRVFFEVSPLEGKIFKVKTCDCTIEVIGTSFTVDRHKLRMHKGVVRLVDPNQQKHLIKAGEEYEFSTSRPVAKNKPLKLKVKNLIKNKSYLQAIKLLKSAANKTSDVKATIKYNLDIASIYGAYLHDFDQACQTMRSLLRNTSLVKSNPGFKMLWSRYRCQH